MAGRTNYHRPVLSEVDLALISALQVAPRADWNRIGAALGVSGATASRRWDALRSQGKAWVTCAPAGQFTGAGMLVSLTAAPGCHGALIQSLSDEPAAATVSLVTGSSDFLVDCFAPDQQTLEELAISTFASLPGVAHRECSFILQARRNANDYRSGALDPQQTRAVSSPAGPSATIATGATGASAVFAVNHTDRVLLSHLCLDGRMSWADLAAAADVSPHTAQRRVERLITSGNIGLRCEHYAKARGALREVNLQLDVPAPQLDQATDYFVRLKECRLSAQVLSNHNLAVSLWVRSLHEVHQHERELMALAPGSRVLGREVSVRSIKRLGHVLDAEGRSVRVVPPLCWTAASATENSK